MIKYLVIFLLYYQQFLAQVEAVLAQGSANKLISEAREGRALYGEATVSVYKKL